MPVEQFPALLALSVPHGFTGRVAGLDVKADRAIALDRLDSHHRQARWELGLGEFPMLTAEQVHGKEVAVVRRDEAMPALPFSGCDGIVTNRDDVCLGIYVADCCAAYLVDPVQGAIGLIHAGKKGAELGIAPVAIERMTEAFATRASDLVVQLSPCIRPPWYEVEFSALVIEQCRNAGVRQIYDCLTCTAENPEQYYSYRREQGRTGRMLAMLALGKGRSESAG